MKRGIFALLGMMIIIAVLALLTQGLEQGMLALAFLGFSVRAYRASEDFLSTGNEKVYERQMNSVQTFTVACAFISFFWPESMYQNATIFLCLVFHIVLNRYVKKARI